MSGNLLVPEQIWTSLGIHWSGWGKAGTKIDGIHKYPYVPGPRV